MTWRPINTAIENPDKKILIARFHPGNQIPDYVISATYGTEWPSFLDCATYSGWFVDGVPLRDPPRRKGVHLTFGILSIDGEWAPTHWMEIPE